MKKLYRKLLFTTALLTPLALFFGLSLRSHPPDDSPLLKVFTGKASGLKVAVMTDERKALANGNEKLVLLQSIFSNAPEFSSFPLIQKRGEFLGTVPNSFADVEPIADLSISEARKKTFYKFQFFSGGVAVDLVAIPENRMSNMGKLPKSKWLRPKDIDYPGKSFPRKNFPYRFKFTAVNTPAGDIDYWVFVSDENPDINKVMEAYIRRQKIPTAPGL